MPALGQIVFYYSQPESTLVASPALYLGDSVVSVGKHAVCVAWTPLGGPGGVTTQGECTLVTESPAPGDISESNLL